MNRYLELSHLIGTEVTIRKQRKNEDGELTSDMSLAAPDRILFEKDYSRTILLKLVYQDFIRYMLVGKAKMFCGDIVIKDHTGTLLVGENVRHQMIYERPSRAILVSAGR